MVEKEYLQTFEKVKVKNCIVSLFFISLANKQDIL